MKGKSCIILLILSCLLTGCGNQVNSHDYVTRERYDSVVAERDALQDQIDESYSEVLKRVRNAFKNVQAYEDLTFYEIQNNDSKSLMITCHMRMTANNNSEKLTEIENVVERLSGESWCIYDYVIINVWNATLGMINSIEINMSDLSLTRSHVWSVDDIDLQQSQSDEDAEGDSQELQLDENPNDEGYIVYQDENVIITYTGISGREHEYQINLLIENLSDKEYMIQARATSINGFMVDPICSIEIAPGKKANGYMKIVFDDANDHPMSSVESVETRFLIVNDDDWNDRYETENVVIK